jgi:hypothetical protein
MKRVAAGLAALVAVIVFVRVSADELPAWVARRVGGVDALAVRGGVIAHYQVIGEPADRKQLIDNVWRRVGAWGIADSWVAWDDRRQELVVALPGVTEERMPAYHGLLEVGGKLEFRMVAHGERAMQRLYGAVMNDPASEPAGVEAHAESWRHEDRRGQRRAGQRQLSDRRRPGHHRALAGGAVPARAGAAAAVAPDARLRAHRAAQGPDLPPARRGRAG